MISYKCEICESLDCGQFCKRYIGRKILVKDLPGISLLARQDRSDTPFITEILGCHKPKTPLSGRYVMHVTVRISQDECNAIGIYAGSGTPRISCELSYLMKKNCGLTYYVKNYEFIS